MQLGVETGALQRQIFVASSLMIGAMVSVSGMIGFVGLMIPARHALDRRQRSPAPAARHLFLPAGFSCAGRTPSPAFCWLPPSCRWESSRPSLVGRSFFFCSTAKAEKRWLYESGDSNRESVICLQDRVVLHGVSLSVERGEMVGILGPNGSGKTTLLKIFSAVLRGRARSRSTAEDIETYGRAGLEPTFCRRTARKPS